MHEEPDLLAVCLSHTLLLYWSHITSEFQQSVQPQRRPSKSLEEDSGAVDLVLMDPLHHNHLMVHLRAIHTHVTSHAWRTNPMDACTSRSGHVAPEHMVLRISRLRG